MEIRGVTGALTSDLANERVEGTLSLGMTVSEESDDEVEITGLDLTLVNVNQNVALEDLRLETNTAFPMRIQPGTSGRAFFRFSAESPLPPPPDLSGWCGPPAQVQLKGSLARGDDFSGFGSAGSLAGAPTLALTRTVALTSDVGARWAGRAPVASNGQVRGLAVDAEGNTLMGTDVVNDFTFEFLPPVVTKFDATGRTLWTRDLGGQGVIFAGVDVAAGDDVAIAAGLFTGSLDLGDGLMDSEGVISAFVTRMDAEGVTLWTRQLRGKSGDDPESWRGIVIHEVEVGASGNVLIAATSDGGPIDIGDEVIEPAPGAAPYWPFSFLVEFSPSGDYLSSQQLGGLIDAMAVDATGAKILAGTFQGTVNLGGETLSVTDQGIWVAKLDAAGQHVFSRAFEASGGSITVSTIALGPGGEIHLSAQTTLGAIDFGQGPRQSSDRGYFVAKLDAQGSPQWSKVYAQSWDESTPGLAVDDAGQVFLLGSASHSIDFGAGPLPVIEGPVLYAAELDPTGAQLRAGLFGCGATLRSLLAFRSGVPAGVSFATTFRQAATLGSQSFATVDTIEIIVGAFDP